MADLREMADLWRGPLWRSAMLLAHNGTHGESPASAHDLRSVASIALALHAPLLLCAIMRLYQMSAKRRRRRKDAANYSDQYVRMEEDGFPEDGCCDECMADCTDGCLEIRTIFHLNVLVGTLLSIPEYVYWVVFGTMEQNGQTTRDHSPNPARRRRRRRRRRFLHLRTSRARADCDCTPDWHRLCRIVLLYSAVLSATLRCVGATYAGYLLASVTEFVSVSVVVVWWSGVLRGKGFSPALQWWAVVLCTAYLCFCIFCVGEPLPPPPSAVRPFMHLLKVVSRGATAARRSRTIACGLVWWAHRASVG